LFKPRLDIASFQPHLQSAQAIAGRDEAPMKLMEQQTGDESCATVTANSYAARSWEATLLRLLITFKF